jgi:hypothetical protein
MIESRIHDVYEGKYTRWNIHVCVLCQAPTNLSKVEGADQGPFAASSSSGLFPGNTTCPMGSLRDTVLQRVDLRPRKEPHRPTCLRRGARVPPFPKSTMVPSTDRSTIVPTMSRWCAIRCADAGYGFLPATVIPITSLGRAGVYFGNTRALVACSKS